MDGLRVVPVVLLVALVVSACGTATDRSTSAAHLNGISVTARDDALVTTEPLGDVVTTEISAGTEVTALCFVARARTNTGMVGSAIRVSAGAHVGYTAVSNFPPAGERPTMFFGVSERVLQRRLPPCSPTDSREPAVREVTVYEIAEGGGHLRLLPLRTSVPATPDPVVDAVTALMEHTPTQRDRSSLWIGICAPAAGVRSVDIEADLITVRLEDFDSDEVGNATCDLSAEGAAAQIQQLVWTVHDAGGRNTPMLSMIDDYQLHPPTQADPTVLAPEN